SAECPYGTENERVMDYAFEIYPALRNRMPATYMEELNRGSDVEPGTSPREYVQWQRGPLTNVPMEKMKAWVDTALVNDNIWLVLVFHGIDGIGWEPRTGEELKEYFAYMKQYEEDLWVATFADVTKYIRERKNTIIEKAVEKDKISLKLTCSLDEKWYSQPLTLKTYVPDDWSNVVLKQNGNNDSTNLQVLQDEQGNYVLFDTSPNKGTLVITGHH
ncbi:MAG: polysaccharide deacetylase family protein, partial [Cyclobacteriaceae bacterium]|nr:polysaccharide deacetylase family protein [Cyclobacteriaceae bacterium]